MTPHNAITFGSRTVLLSEIAGYSQWMKRAGKHDERYGITFHLKSGESLNVEGDSDVLRDRVIEFLHKHFEPVEFLTWKCDSCENYEDDPEDPGTCIGKDCSSWDLRPRFKAIEQIIP